MQTDDTRLMSLMAPIDDVEAMAALSQRLDHDKLILEHGHMEVAFKLRRSWLRVQDTQRLLHAERRMALMVLAGNAADDDVGTGLQVQRRFRRLAGIDSVRTSHVLGPGRGGATA